MAWTLLKIIIQQKLWLTQTVWLQLKVCILRYYQAQIIINESALIERCKTYRLVISIDSFSIQ
jgi:hypothetical protein